MNSSSSKSLRMVDYLIFIFFLLFLLSLTNSIFVNQVGYFGSLILILIRFFISKENRFNKTGLEIAFVLFIAAEFLSAIFSDYSAQAFTNAVKRSLLLPIVYTTVIASTDFNRAKTYFKVYIGASLISVCIYLYFAYHHYLENLYGLTQSGPSLFQYPITASEIISFTVVFLFAFLINEKTNFKVRLFLLFSFLLSLAALLSTYKRTGWTGAAFGILTVLIVRKQWKTIFAGAVIVVLLILFEKNESSIKYYDYTDNKLNLESVEETDGKASHIYPVDEKKIVVCDFENGLLLIENTKVIDNLSTPAPVVSFSRWNENLFVAQLIDTRFLLVEMKENTLKTINEFVSPGLTFGYKISGGKLFVLDSDSGLTIFNNPELLSDTVRYVNVKNQNQVFAESSIVILKGERNLVNILKEDSGELVTLKNDISFDQIFYKNNYLFGFNQNGIMLFQIENSELKLLDELSYPLKIHSAASFDDRIFLLTTDLKLIELSVTKENELKIQSENTIDQIPAGFAYNDNKIIFVSSHESRLLSIFDPNNPTNQTRFALWRGGIEIFKNHPVFGVGDISLENYYRQYKRPFDKEIHGHLHNNFFHILATLGLFGFTAVCFLFYRIIRTSLNIFSSTKNEKFVSSYALGAIGAFAAFLISGLTELNFGDQEIITLVWFTVGLNIAFHHHYTRQQKAIN